MADAFKELTDIIAVMPPAIAAEIMSIFGAKMIQRTVVLMQAGLTPGVAIHAAEDTLAVIRSTVEEAAREQKGGR